MIGGSDEHGVPIAPVVKRQKGITPQEVVDLSAASTGLSFTLTERVLRTACAASPDVTLKDIARLADAFYLGGTKCGTLACEALVIKNPTQARLPGTDAPASTACEGRLGGVQLPP